jgi:hypothetical protein
MSNKTLAQFMSEVREYILKEPGETDEQYRQRLHDIAKPLFTKYMDGVQARWQADQERRARREEYYAERETLRYSCTKALDRTPGAHG